MEYNLFNKIRSMYNYKDNVSIGTLSCLGVLTSGVCGIYSTQLPLSLICLLIESLSVTITLSSLFGSEASFKDIKNIRKIYEQVLENYIKLNKKFELKHPIELLTLYSSVYGEGYLSLNHKFQYDTKNVYDLKSIYGANVINGAGCCRHVNTMFHDILEKSGIENIILAGNSSITKKNVFAINRIDELINKRLDLEEAQKLTSRQLTKIKREMENLQKKLKRKIQYNSDETFNVLTDHVISGSVFNEEICFLDPTNANVAKRIDEYLIMNGKDTYFMIAYNKINFYNRGKKLSELKEKIKLSEVSLEDKYRYVNNASSLVSDFPDEFERFYNENKEAYEEIGDLLTKTKYLTR